MQGSYALDTAKMDFATVNGDMDWAECATLWISFSFFILFYENRKKGGGKSSEVTVKDDRMLLRPKA